MRYAYYVRYGLMGQVGQFVADTAGVERGQQVVLHSHRGTELGEVLLPASPPPSVAGESAQLLRAANELDRARAQQVALDRQRQFDLCRKVFEDGIWPFDLIDVEPLLDERRTVVHYLGPHDLDMSGLLAIFRTAHGLDVVFEPAGRDASEQHPRSSEDGALACGHCGESGGGCGSPGGCGEGVHAGCSDCALMSVKGRARLQRVS
jgi:hypothetical protein